MITRVYVLYASQGWRTTIDGRGSTSHTYMVDAIDEAIRLTEEVVGNGDAAEIYIQTSVTELQSLEAYMAKDPFVRDALFDKLQLILHRAPKPKLVNSSAMQG